jgi:hypothetical protein
MARRYEAEKLPSSPCEWRWSSTTRIRQALGFESTKIPASFHGRFKVDGWDIVVKRGKKGAPRKTAEHRIYVNHGGRLVPAGRVQQALCRTNIHKARRRASKHRSAGGRFTYR